MHNGLYVNVQMHCVYAYNGTSTFKPWLIVNRKNVRYHSAANRAKVVDS